MTCIKPECSILFYGGHDNNKAMLYKHTCNCQTAKFAFETTFSIMT